MKLTYWYAECLNDSDAYAIREKTKKAAKARLEQGYRAEDYGPILKVTVEYADAFDLMDQCSNEGRMYWEAQAVLAHDEKTGASYTQAAPRVSEVR